MYNIAVYLYYLDGISCSWKINCYTLLQVPSAAIFTWDLLWDDSWFRPQPHQLIEILSSRCNCVGIIPGGIYSDNSFQLKGHRHIRFMSNFRLYFALFAQMPKKLKTDKLMFHNNAKTFVSLQVLKAIILCSLQKKRQNVYFTSVRDLKDAFFTYKNSKMFVSQFSHCTFCTDWTVIWTLQLWYVY